MLRILVIADDFTGAAEIGGIAHLFGFSVRISTGVAPSVIGKEDVLVIDTNTRNLPPRAALKKVRNVLKDIKKSDFDLIYKKVDSVLRGPITSEVRAVMTFSTQQMALLVPANPSRKRTIQGGQYRIDDLPVSKTDFRKDPDYPRLSDEVCDLVVDSDEFLKSGEPHASHYRGIYIPDAICEHDLQSLIQKYSISSFLPAGGADFFRAVLKYGLHVRESRTYSYFNPGGQKHLVTGTKHRQSEQTISTLLQDGYTFYDLPVKALQSKHAHDDWLKLIKRKQDEGSNLIIARPGEMIEDGKHRANIVSLLSRTFGEILKGCTPRDEIYLEGGETASSSFRMLEPVDLRIKEVLADGVIKLETNRFGGSIIVKPGSYPWPEGTLLPGKT